MTMEIPVSADGRLQQEIHDLVEFRHRKAGSSTQTLPMTITVTYILERAGKGLKVEVEFRQSGAGSQAARTCRNGTGYALALRGFHL